MATGRRSLLQRSIDWPCFRISDRHTCKCKDTIESFPHPNIKEIIMPHCANITETVFPLRRMASNATNKIARIANNFLSFGPHNVRRFNFYSTSPAFLTIKLNMSSHHKRIWILKQKLSTVAFQSRASAASLKTTSNNAAESLRTDEYGANESPRRIPLSN